MTGGPWRRTPTSWPPPRPLRDPLPPPADHTFEAWIVLTLILSYILLIALLIAGVL